MKLFKAFAAGLATFFIAYLLGAFVAISFDITQWDGAVRGMVAVLGGGFSFLAAVWTREDSYYDR